MVATDRALVEETMATRMDPVETEISLLPSADTDLSLDPQDRTVDRATTAEIIAHPHMATATAAAVVVAVVVVVDTIQEAVVVAIATARVVMVPRALEVVRVAQGLSVETVAVAAVDRPQVAVAAAELTTLTNASA